MPPPQARLKSQTADREADRIVSPSSAVQLLRLSGLFVIWKAFLLLIIASSPGPGYDTSTAVLFKSTGKHAKGYIEHVILRLTRWDGIYFAANSGFGYTYEQQWAFSWAATRLSSLLTNVLSLVSNSLPTIALHSFAGIVIALAAHLGTTLLLFVFTQAVLPSKAARSQQIAFTAAALNIVSPAGVFLIAPYGESLYAMLSIAGALFYVDAIKSRSIGASRQDIVWTISAGVMWGLASMMRGNGLLNGIIFAWDLAGMLIAFLLGDRNLQQLSRMFATTIAGLCIAAGYALPQYIAYQEFCQPEFQRPWCARRLPSIYSWVQDHYWEVGFLKYWTLSNLPLFVLATPMLVLLLITGYGALHHARSILLNLNGEERQSQLRDTTYQTKRLIFVHVFERLAVPQLVLTILAATTFHVQIINRISSGYPLWYAVLAIAIHDESPKLACGHPRAEHYFPFRHIGGRRTKYIVRGMVIYAIVQAGLYSSFLPPA